MCTVQRILHALLLLLLVVSQSHQACYKPILTDTPGWIVSDGTSYSLGYSCGLREDHVSGTTGLITFTVDDSGCPGSCSGLPFACGEIASVATSLHGFYNCTMKPPGVAGTLTKCMVSSSTRAPYEEIHFMFIGNDTSSLYLGFYTNGQSYQAGPVRLNFFANEEFHSYAFQWTSDYIKWFVDDKEISSEMGSRPIPTTPNRFVISVLAETNTMKNDNSVTNTQPNVNRNFVAGTTAQASFTNISFTPVPIENCDTSVLVPGTYNWTGYDTEACSTGPTTVIFTESLQGGWSDSGSSPHKLNANNYMHSGTTSISWDVIPAGRLYFRYSGTVDTTKYYGIEYWVFGGGNWNAPFDTQLLLQGGGTSIVVPITKVLGAGVQAWEWSRVVIPFELFNLGESTTITGFLLNSTSTNFVGTLYVDDVRLIQKYPVCANSTLYIYEDGLNSKFLDWSWGGSYNLKSTSPVFSGSYAIAWEAYDNDGLKFHTNSPVDTTMWEAVSMHVNYQKLQGWELTIAITSNGQSMGKMGILDYYGGSFPPGEWVRFVVPFHAFGILPGTPVDGVELTCNTKQYQGILSIDDVAFISSLPPDVTTSAAVHISTSFFFVILQVFFVCLYISL